MLYVSVKVRTDLEKSLNLTLVLENSWNLKIVLFVLNCEIVLENNEIHQFFTILLDLCEARKKTVKIAGYFEERGASQCSNSVYRCWK